MEYEQLKRLISESYPFPIARRRTKTHYACLRAGTLSLCWQFGMLVCHQNLES